MSLPLNISLFRLVVRGAAIASLLAAAGCDAIGPKRSPGAAILPPSALVALGVQGCGAEGLGASLGKPFPVLADVQMAGHLRVLRPGQGITRDLVPTRLNAEVDGQGRILRLFCG